MSRTNDDPRGERMESPEAECQRLIEERDVAIAQHRALERNYAKALREMGEARREWDTARAELQKVKLRLGEVADIAEALLHRAYTVLDRCHHRLNETLSAPALRIDIEAVMGAIREALPK